MKKTLRQFLILPAIIFAITISTSKEAAAQAYDMIYQDTIIATSSGLLSHSFSFDLYQNCNPAPVNFSNLPVVYNSGAGPAVTETLAGGLPVLGIGNPFCGTQNPVCAGSGPLNYQRSGTTYTFTAKGNYSAPGHYTMSTEFTPYGVGFGNFQAANITGNFSIDPRILNTVSTSFNATSTITNKPPQFLNPPVIFANVNQLLSYNCGALDPDGDSLVYRLRPVSPNATYAPGFTYLNPIMANPALYLHPQTGVITFAPSFYDQAAGPGATSNKYVIGIDIEEYPRSASVGSSPIGKSQRNVLVNVISNSNNTPMLGGSLNNSVGLTTNSVIEVTAGTPVTLDFFVFDPDATDNITMTTNIGSIFPGVYLVGSPLNPRAGQITWTPTNADVRKSPYYFQVTATDNACPYPGSSTNSYGFRVKAAVTGISADAFKPQLFSVFPNPASHEVNFKFETRKARHEILIYNVLGKQIDRIALSNSNQKDAAIRRQQAEKYPAGTYIAKLISEDRIVQTLKFTKLQ